MPCSPAIQAFFEGPTNTVSYLVSDPHTKQVQEIDPVLDYEPKTGKATTGFADAILAAAKTYGLNCLGSRDPCSRRSFVRCALYQAEDRRPGLDR